MQVITKLHVLSVFLAATVTRVSPVLAQQANRTTEMYHIFDLKTQASRGQVIRAALNPNVFDSHTMTPIVMGAPPETPVRFDIVDPLQDGRFGAFAGMIGAAQAAQLEQVRCNVAAHPRLAAAAPPRGRGPMSKTVNHPCQIGPTHFVYQVEQADYEEARALTANDARSVYAAERRMVEPATHRDGQKRFLPASTSLAFGRWRARSPCRVEVATGVFPLAEFSQT